MPNDGHVLVPHVLGSCKLDTQINPAALCHKVAIALSCVDGSWCASVYAEWWLIIAGADMLLCSHIAVSVVQDHRIVIDVRSGQPIPLLVEHNGR